MKLTIIEALQELRDKYREEANRYTSDSTLYHSHHDEGNAVQAAINTVKKIQGWPGGSAGELDFFRHEIERGELQHIINIILQQPANTTQESLFRDRIVHLLQLDGVEPERGHLNKVNPKDVNAENFAIVLNELVDAVEDLRAAWSRRWEP